MNGTTMSPYAWQWHKSSYSGKDGNCIEVAALRGGFARVWVRDSKDPDGPSLGFSAEAWASFVSEVDTGTFDRR